jgi:predicted transcriptional regulator
MSEKVGLYRTTVYDYVNALYNRGLIESDKDAGVLAQQDKKYSP